MLDNMAEGDTADDFVIDENSLELTQLLDNLREEVKLDESIAMKSAMLLKLLEVSLQTVCTEISLSSKFAYLGHTNINFELMKSNDVDFVNLQWNNLRTITF